MQLQNLGAPITYTTMKSFHQTILLFYQKDRDSRGGEVFLAVHTSIQSKLIGSPASLKVVSVEIITHHKIVLCLLYIPPQASVLKLCVSDLLQNLSTITQNHNIIFGDFNFPDIN